MDESLHPSLLDRLGLLSEDLLQDLSCRIVGDPVANEEGDRDPGVGRVPLPGVEELLDHLSELDISHDRLLKFLQELLHRFFIGGGTSSTAFIKP